MDEESTRHDAAGTKHVARGSLANLIGAVYSGLASFAITALIARISTTEDAGVYFSAVSILLMAVALAQLGTPTGYVYFLARYRGLNRAEDIRPTLVSGALPVLALGIIMVVISIAFREPLGDLLFGSQVDGRSKIMMILASALLIAIAGDSALGATRGLGVMRPTVIADHFVNPTVQLLALLLLALGGWTGGEELTWTRVAGFVAVAVIGVPWLAKFLQRVPAPDGRTARRTWMPTKQNLHEFWHFTGPRAIGQIALTGIQRVDIVFVALWLGPADAAVYAAATRFLVFGQLAARAIGMAVQPRISTLAARGEFDALQDLYRASTAWAMFATWPLYMTFIVQAPWLMHIFGPEYARGAFVLQILSAAMLIGTACGSVDAVLLMAGRSTLTMINAWVALALNVGLNVLLIPYLGILGATLAWVAAILATNVVPLVQVRITLGVHPYGRVTFLALVFPVLLFGAVPFAISQLGWGIMGALASFAGASALYVPLLWRLRATLGLTGLRRRG